LILSILIGLPLLGALLVALFPQEKATKTLSLLTSATVFFFSLALYTGFDIADGGFQYKESYPFVPNLGIHYSLGIDGLSLWLILLTTFVTPLVILGSFRSVGKDLRGYYACVLLMEASVIGTLSATDLFLFYLFWELMLIPAFFLIGLWGTKDRVRATLKFVLFTMLGSLFMLVALLYVTHEVKSFDYARIFDHFFPEDVQFWCFLAFAAAFLIKVPLFPFHGWLPDAYTEAPTGGTVLLSAVLVKLGAYGLLRFCIPLFPNAAQEFAPFLLILAVAGVLHGALMATLQTDLKRLIAYSSLSHMGLVVLGIFTFSLTGLQGSLFQMVSHGAAIAGLFLLAGMIHSRSGSREAGDHGGLAKAAPVLAVLFLWIMLSSVGLPGFSGFIGEVLILVSAFKAAPVLAVIAVAGFVLSAWYMFNLYGRLFLGAPKKDMKFPDLHLSELLAVLPLAAVVLWMGLHPNFFLRPMEKTLQVKVIEKLKPPPAMLDFAVQQRRIQEEVEKEKKRR
jgi:NADH-quinone oxidoreductase subunit M